MPRAPRIDIPGLIYHVMNRGVRRLPIYFADSDRQHFLRLLSRTREEIPFRLHAYCLMGNHYHLLLQPLDTSLSQIMHYFKTLYAVWFRRQYGHPGHVFQGRFHSIPVEEDAYLTTVARYIHLNPVRAGLAARPESYPWSNYGKLMRGEADALVDPSFILNYFGKDTASQRERYRLFVESELGKPEPIDERVLQKMRFWGQPPRELSPPLSLPR